MAQPQQPMAEAFDPNKVGATQQQQAQGPGVINGNAFLGVSNTQGLDKIHSPFGGLQEQPKRGNMFWSNSPKPRTLEGFMMALGIQTKAMITAPIQQSNREAIAGSQATGADGRPQNNSAGVGMGPAEHEQSFGQVYGDKNAKRSVFGKMAAVMQSIKDIQAWKGFEMATQPVRISPANLGTLSPPSTAAPGFSKGVGIGAGR